MSTSNSKEGKNSYEFEELIKYCCALANEGGGYFILGVTDQKPRKIVGSRAFSDLSRTKAGLIERLRIRIDVEELLQDEKRVVFFEIPSRPIGVPLEYKGAYWMRAGESLVPMTADKLKSIFAEAHPDFSAQICPTATINDLEPRAILEFGRRWATRTKRTDLLTFSSERLLHDAELILDAGITYAALVLFGSRQGLGKHLAQAEVIFEYRADEVSIPYQQRLEFRSGLFLFHDELWSAIETRNERFSFQNGLFRFEIPAFNEEAVREAILNAISHRDYRLEGSIFVRQSPTKLEVVSPGGFPPGVTAESILFKQSPRNRRIAEALSRCGLVERSGQGADRMFGAAIREGKLPPDFRGTDTYQVAVTLNGKVRDPSFLVFLEKISAEQSILLHIDDLLVLDAVHRELPVPQHFSYRIPSLVSSGVIEKVGKGRGQRYLLSQKYYSSIGRQGVYTRKLGLDKNTNKALLLKHIQRSGEEGSPMYELTQVLPALSQFQIQRLLGELKEEGAVILKGKNRGARWYPLSRA